MKKIFLGLLCVFITLLSWTSYLIPTEAAPAKQTTYVALGDSITSGYGLESFNNNDSANRTSVYNFTERLGKTLGMKTVNLGIEGIDSTMLLKSLSNPVTKEEKNAIAQIKGAGLISISIGGNNVFIPLLNSVNDNIPKGKNIYNANTAELQAAVLTLLFDVDRITKLKENIAKGAEAFTGSTKLKKTGDFSAIISKLKALNPKAEIIVQTIYNPYELILPDSVGKAIKDMNAEIIKGSGEGKNYKVADVYSAFLKAGKDIPLINSASGTALDPHPTKRGHEVIHNLLAYAINGKLPYSLKLTISNGKAVTVVREGEFVVIVTPAKGYRLPETISLTIGKSSKRTLVLKNGAATMPIAAINGAVAVTAACSK